MLSGNFKSSERVRERERESLSWFRWVGFGFHRALSYVLQKDML